MKLIMNVDGGSRGNPGPGAAGITIADESGSVLLEAGYYLGHTTNNRAEYTALLRALEAAAARGATEVLVKSDSELLVRQINGDYRVRSADLVPLFNEARARLGRFERWTVQHVRREFNSRADELANRSMDARSDVVELDASDGPSQPERSATRGRGN